MDLHEETGTEAQFRCYAADLASVLGHADRISRSTTTASDCCRLRAARASSRSRR